MKRYYYEGNGVHPDIKEGYSIFDRKRGCRDPLAEANDVADAQLIVDALNEMGDKRVATL